MLRAASLVLLATLAGLAPPVSCAAEDTAAQARLDYMLNCQGCHLDDGRGYPGRVPDLRRTYAALLAVPGGREYVLRVPGAATARLDDARLAGVLNWMLAQFGAQGGDVVPFSAVETARLRVAPLTDVATARAKLAPRAGLPVAY